MTCATAREIDWQRRRWSETMTDHMLACFALRCRRPQGAELLRLESALKLYCAELRSAAARAAEVAVPPLSREARDELTKFAIEIARTGSVIGGADLETIERRLAAKTAKCRRRAAAGLPSNVVALAARRSPAL